ncbi:MAG: tetraacyldisaccharide 4'-kinase [Burkholderiaceae bacterium]
MASVAQTLQSAWQSRGLLAWMLWPLSLVYAALWRVHVTIYRLGLRRAWRAPVPVVVVGNVVAGGAGKTPVTIALAEHLRARGWAPGVVSRGHGRSDMRCLAVHPDSDPREVGDEPLLIAQRTGLPVQVAARRADAVRALLARDPRINVVICDDGLQHLALARDIEVLVTDERLAGNGWLLPAGPLREPWPRRCDLWLHHASAAPAGAFGMQRTLATHARRADGTRKALADLRAQPVHALAGIAHPQRFFDALSAQGLHLVQCHALPDHARLDDAAQAKAWGAPLVCTEKDAVKLWRHRPDAWAVGLDATLPPAALQSLDTLLQAARQRRLSSGHGHPSA